MSQDKAANSRFRIGILGGMGPEAGVFLQQLIIEATPARSDQEHLEVLTYTNPRIPDRTRSLQDDGGESYLRGVVESLALLEAAGVDILVMACNTAHARIAEIEKSVRTPFLNIVELARREIVAAKGRVAILATDGTVGSGLFSIAEQPEKTVAPDAELQREVMAIIHDIKKGVRDASVAARLERVVRCMQQTGCERVVLGCTELSLYSREMRELFGEIFIDPMLLAARRLVELAARA